MQDSRLPRLVFVLLAAAALAQFIFYYAQLPATMASHFDARGVPNGFQSKPVFFAFFLGAILIAALVALGVPRLIAAMPVELINLPNKEYWLGPERCQASLDFLAAQMAWLGCAILFVVAFAFHFSIQANLHPPIGFDSRSFLMVLGAFFLFLMVWLVRFFTRFARPPAI